MIGIKAPGRDRHIGATGGSAYWSHVRGRTSRTCRALADLRDFGSRESSDGPKEFRDVSVSTGPGALAPGRHRPRHRPFEGDGAAQGREAARAGQRTRLAVVA